MILRRKICSTTTSLTKIPFNSCSSHNYRDHNTLHVLTNEQGGMLKFLAFSKLVSPKFTSSLSKFCFVRNPSYLVRNYCSVDKPNEWTEDIEYLDESGQVIFSGKGTRSVQPGLDDHVMVGGLKKPILNASAVAKIIEVVNRWKWGPELETQLDKLQFVPNMTHVTQALKVVKDSDAALSLFQWCKRKAWYTSNDECFAMIFDYLNKSNKFEEIQLLFDEMVRDSSGNGNLSFSSCNRVIQYLAKAEKLEVSFCCFKKIQDSGYS